MLVIHRLLHSHGLHVEACSPVLYKAIPTPFHEPASSARHEPITSTRLPHSSPGPNIRPYVVPVQRARRRAPDGTSTWCKHGNRHEAIPTPCLTARLARQTPVAGRVTHLAGYDCHSYTACLLSTWPPWYPCPASEVGTNMYTPCKWGDHHGPMPTPCW